MKNILCSFLIFVLVIFIIVFFSLRVVKEGFADSTSSSQEKAANDIMKKIQGLFANDITNNIATIQAIDIVPEISSSNDYVTKIVNEAVLNKKLVSSDQGSVNLYLTSVINDVNTAMQNAVDSGKFSKANDGLKAAVTRKVQQSLSNISTKVRGLGYIS